MIGPPSMEYRQTINYAIDEQGRTTEREEDLLAHLQAVKVRFPDARRTSNPEAFTSASVMLEECNELSWHEDSHTVAPCVKIGRCRVYIPKGERDIVDAHITHLIQFPNVVRAIKELLDAK